MNAWMRKFPLTWHWHFDVQETSKQKGKIIMRNKNLGWPYSGTLFYLFFLESKISKNFLGNCQIFMYSFQKCFRLITASDISPPESFHEYILTTILTASWTSWFGNFLIFVSFAFLYLDESRYRLKTHKDYHRKDIWNSDRIKVFKKHLKNYLLPEKVYAVTLFCMRKL